MGTATSSLLNFSGSLKQLLIFLRLPWRRLAVLLRRGAAELRPLQGDGPGQPPLLAQLQLQLLQDKLSLSHVPLLSTNGRTAPPGGRAPQLHR